VREALAQESTVEKRRFESVRSAEMIHRTSSRSHSTRISSRKA
jgi:hypothetical protein